VYSVVKEEKERRKDRHPFERVGKGKKVTLTSQKGEGRGGIWCSPPKRGRGLLFGATRTKNSRVGGTHREYSRGRREISA